MIFSSLVGYIVFRYEYVKICSPFPQLCPHSRQVIHVCTLNRMENELQMAQLFKHARALQKCTVSSFFSTNLQLPPSYHQITCLQSLLLTLPCQFLCTNWQFEKSLEYSDQGEDEISLQIFNRFNVSIYIYIYILHCLCITKAYMYKLEHRKTENPYIVLTQ